LQGEQEEVHEQESGIGPSERAQASELVGLAARARRAFPRGGADITETQVLLALALAVDVGGCGVSETAIALSLDGSTVSHAIRQLRGQGLVGDAACPADGRRRAYSLTRAGERAVAQYLREAPSP
jgi:DNA-binding transcriptional ArsR family regulator